jgi:membrane fusion protein, adhesin transport system
MKQLLSQPEPLEEMESLGKGFTLMLLFLLFVLIGLVLWLSFAQLDVVSIAQGTVIPSGKVRKIQHLEGGIVREILVAEGDTVDVSQPLVVLESTASGSDYNELNARMSALQASQMRYEAEAAGKNELILDPGFVSSNPDLARNTLELFKARREKQQSKLSAQKQTVIQRVQNISEITSRLESAKTRLILSREQVAIGEKLLANKLSNRYEQIERLKELMRLESRIAEDKAAVKRARAALEQAKSHLVEKEYAEEVQIGLAEVSGRIAELSEQLAKYKDNLARAVLKSPIKGLVKTLHIFTIGGVLPPGGVVLDLVPLNERPIVVAHLEPQDVGYIQVGQEAFVQLDSMDAPRLGKISGKVEHISPDTLLSQDGRSFYVVKIGLEKDWFGQEKKQYALHPGIIVNAGIITGRRTVLHYLLSPFTNDITFSFSER